MGWDESTPDVEIPGAECERIYVNYQSLRDVDATHLVSFDGDSSSSAPVSPENPQMRKANIFFYKLRVVTNAYKNL